MDILVNPPGGTNSQTAINNAITTASNSGGGTVTLGPGTFIISGYIRMKNNVTLKGTVSGTTKQSRITLVNKAYAISGGDFYVTQYYIDQSWSGGDYCPNASALIYGKGVSNCVVTQLSINPNPEGQTAIKWGRGYFNCIKFESSTNIKVNNIEIGGYNRYGHGDGVHFNIASGNIEVNDIWVSNPGLGHDGIYIKRSAGTTLLHNNSIYQHTNSGIRVDNSASVKIYENCIYRSSDKQANSGIQLDHNSADFVVNYDVSYNVISGSMGPGMQITATNKDVSTTTKKITASNHKVWVHHNLIYGCGQGTDDDYRGGIHIAPQPNTVIENNTIHGNYGNGILIRQYYGFNIGRHVIAINNNNITGTLKHSKYAGYGIGQFDATNGAYLLTNNNVWNNPAGNYYNANSHSSDISIDPQYVAAGSGDFHLKSNFGSWHQASSSWVKDANRSGCIRLTGQFPGTEIGRFNGCWDQSKQKEDVVIPKPFASFKAGPTSGKVPLLVDFIDQSTNNPTSWLWDFGDGTTATTQNAKHTYTEVGSFTAKLTVANSQGSSTVYLIVTVSSGDNEQGGVAASTDLDNSGPDGGGGSSGGTQGRVFHVGPGQTYNGTTETAINQAIQAASVGDTVMLHPATYNISGHIFMKSGIWLRGTAYNTVVIIGGPNAGGKISVKGTADGVIQCKPCSNVEISHFTYKSTSTSHSDGGKGDQRHSIYFGGGSNIKIHDISFQRFTFNDAANLHNVSNVRIYNCYCHSCNHDFVQILAGCSDVHIVNCWIRIEGNSGVRFDNCKNSSVEYCTFDGNYGGWNIIELQNKQSGNVVDHCVFKNTSFGVFGYAGAVTSRSCVYCVSTGAVSISSANGNILKASASTDWTSRGYGYGVKDGSPAGSGGSGGSGSYTGPISKFTYKPTWGTGTVTVSFADASTGSPTAYEWDFGDGSAKSTAKNPIHTYSSSGTYTITLKVSIGSKWSRSYASVTVKSPSGSLPSAEFTGTPVSGIAPLEVAFTDASKYLPTSWKWSFGDKISAITQNPRHTYSEPGTYTVKLTATNSHGSNTKSKAGYISVKEYNPFTGSKHDARIKLDTPDIPFGDKPYLDIGSTAASTYRSLLWFNLDAYKDKEIEKAVIQLYWYFPDTVRESDTLIEVYRPACIWNPAEVTWNKPISSTPWNNPGGDWRDKYGEAQGTIPFGTLEISGSTVADKAYHEIDVTDLVRAYLEGTYKNYGFLLKAQTELNNYMAFYSSECGTNVAVPKLVVTEKVDSVEKQIIYIGPVGTADISYTCDGIDDHIQINQALKLVSENQTKYSGVYIKGPFTYEINDTLLIGSNTTLEGDSTAVVKLKTNCGWEANKPMIKEVGSSTTGINVKGFKIDGNRENQSAIVSGKNYHNIMHFTGVKNIVVSDMYLTNNHSDGLKTTNCENVKFIDNTVYLLGHDGLYCSNTPYVEAGGNTITCRTNTGLRVYNSNHVKFYSNVLTSMGSGTAGMELTKEGTVLMNDVEIYDNDFHGVAQSGIRIYTASSYNANTSSFYIHHNKFWDCGIKQNTLCGGIVLNGVNAIIENNTIDGNYIAGIAIKNTNDSNPIVTGTLTVTLRSNIITGTIGGFGIIKDASAAVTTVVPQNNVLFNNGTGGSDHYSGVTAPSGNYINIIADPLYANQATHDYHLKSKAGRYDGTRWVVDTVSSPAIDTGYYDFPIAELLEPAPNGSRINCGMYGNTKYASMSGDLPISVNRPPVLDTLQNRVTEIGELVSFTVSAVDADGDNILYAINPLPTGATFNSSSGVFSWTPTTGQEGTYSIEFSATDGIASDSKTMTIGVVKDEIFTYLTGKIYCNRLKSAASTTVFNDNAYIDIGGKTDNGIFRNLIYVDLSEYTGKSIISAELRLYWYHPAGSERTNDTVIQVYRPVAWDYSYASWTKRVNGTNWVAPGGDWNDSNGTLNGNSPFATFTIPKDVVPDNTYHALDITELVQSYVNGTNTNTGFLLKAADESDNYVAFYSSELGVDEQRLKLAIQYTV